MDMFRSQIIAWIQKQDVFSHQLDKNNTSYSFSLLIMKLYWSNISCYCEAMGTRKVYIGSLVFSFSRQFNSDRHCDCLLHNVQLLCIGKISEKSSFLCKSSLVLCFVILIILTNAYYVRGEQVAGCYIFKFISCEFCRNFQTYYSQADKIKQLKASMSTNKS